MPLAQDLLHGEGGAVHHRLLLADVRRPGATGQRSQQQAQNHKTAHQAPPPTPGIGGTLAAALHAVQTLPDHSQSGAFQGSSFTPATASRCDPLQPRHPQVADGEGQRLMPAEPQRMRQRGADRAAMGDDHHILAGMGRPPAGPAPRRRGPARWRSSRRPAAPPPPHAARRDARGWRSIPASASCAMPCHSPRCCSARSGSIASGCSG